MAYIQLHQTLFTHRKTLAAAKSLHIDRIQMAGHMASLWCWSLDNAPDGTLPRDHGIVAQAAGWTKNTMEFVSALKHAEFLDDGPNGEWIIHDWNDYAGRLIEERAKSKERMRQFRLKQQANK